MTSIFNPPDVLDTPRLVVRKPRANDAQALFEGYTQDPRVTHFLVWRPHTSLAETTAYLKDCEAQWAAAASWPYLIELRNKPGSPIGAIHLRRDGTSISFGYVLAHQHWGNGLMPEAIVAAIDWSLAQPQIWRTWAICDIENKASARVMEKSGMAFEGIVRRMSVHPNISDEPRDCRLYAKVR
jgi:RimJ/RimL family protein N-acetyltransferase